MEGKRFEKIVGLLSPFGVQQNEKSFLHQEGGPRYYFYKGTLHREEVLQLLKHRSKKKEGSSTAATRMKAAPYRPAWTSSSLLVQGASGLPKKQQRKLIESPGLGHTHEESHVRSFAFVLDSVMIGYCFGRTEHFDRPRAR